MNSSPYIVGKSGIEFDMRVDFGCVISESGQAYGEASTKTAQHHVVNGVRRATLGASVIFQCRRFEGTCYGLAEFNRGVCVSNLDLKNLIYFISTIIPLGTIGYIICLDTFPTNVRTVHR
jgi:hypothetical protein